MKTATVFLVLVLVASAAAVVLERGDQGADVFGIQYLLNARGMGLSVDGDFGPGTEGGVIAFQQSRGLSATGKMNIQTFNQLITTIQRGSTNGNAVKAAQYLLKHKWFKYTSSVDGDFGPGTETAVKNFQYSKSLGADGVVGPQSWSALFSGQSATGGSGSGSSRSQLAQQILDSNRITLANVHVAQYSSAVNSARYYDSTALKNVQHQAQGVTPYTSCYGNAPCSRAALSISMMECILSASNSLTLSISSLVGSSHSSSSKHYNGWAVDVNFVNGVHVARSGAGYTGALAFSSICRAFGASLVLDPSNEPQYHHNHVHCQWNTSN
mmetsp:Transcript_11180/g.45504  ORF Transcript_11180/g.45504 Transcript_11180/m.45504 type:complete len:326 (+) Transcript_11180:90-1067(+)